MTKKIRTILFSISAVFFLLAAPLAVFYSMGYRFDFERKKIIQVGTVYVKILPKNAQVSVFPLDKKQLQSKTKKTDFFFGAAFFENLLPQKYEIEIKKEGFQGWEKTLEIEEKKVTDAKNIILVPEKFNFASLSKNIENFFVFPDEEKLILKEANEKGWSLKLFETKNNVKSHLISDKDLARTKINLSDLEFSRDSKKILLKTEMSGNEKYFLLNLDDTPLSLLSLGFLKESFDEIRFNPENSQKLLLLRKGEISEADLSKKIISPTSLKDIVSFQVDKGDVFYLDASGFLFKTDLSFRPGEKLNEVPLATEKGGRYQIYVFSEKAFVQDERNLFLFNPESKSFEKFLETKKGPKLSPNREKIVYFSDYEIRILYSEPELTQPWKSAGEKSFIARFSEKIGDVFWYGSYHLIFNVGNKIKVAEIDDRDKINIADLATFETNLEENNLSLFKIFFNQNDKKIYVLNRQNFSSSQNPLP